MSNNCIQQKTKKYTSRNSPPYPANDCKNQIKKGNDGQQWQSQPNKSMIYRWVPMTTASKRNTNKRDKRDKSNKTHKNTKTNHSIKASKDVKTYYIHDNGGRPFKVIVDHGKQNLVVYKDTRTDEDFEEDSEPKYDEVILETKFIKFWDGGPIPKFQGKTYYTFKSGNSILISTGIGKYIYIGYEIYSFQTGNSADDQIENYVSLIGNSDVPYPFATSKKYTYLMIENVFIDNELLHRDTTNCNHDCNIDAYCLYYGFCKERPHDVQKLIKKNAKPISRKVIHKRLY